MTRAGRVDRRLVELLGLVGLATEKARQFVGAIGYEAGSMVEPPYAEATRCGGGPGDSGPQPHPTADGASTMAL